jgi:histidine triad (HIT) family protein
MSDCLFCKIVEKQVKSDIVFEDDRVVAFKDISPKAPVHLLIIPRKHIPTLNDLEGPDENLMGHVLSVAKELSVRLKIDKSGYRVVINTNHDAGQAVLHVHFHLLGGRPLDWPPG